MGKGDRKSKRGKIIMGTYGKTRPARKRKVKVVMPEPPPAAEAKKAPAKKKAAPKKKKEAEG